MSASIDLDDLVRRIKHWGEELGFQQIGIASLDLEADERHLELWLEAQRHGTMSYMARHGRRRSRPEALVPGTARVVCARMDYWPPRAQEAADVLSEPTLGYVSRYALGRD